MFVRLLFLAGLCVGLVSLLSLFGRYHWGLDLMSHFRPQYFMFLMVGGCALFALKQKKQAGLLVSLAAFNLISILPLFWGSTGTSIQASGAASIRCLSINLLSGNNDSQAVCQAVENAQPQVVVFLEVNSWWQAELEKQLADEYAFIQARPREDNFGISIFSKLLPSGFEVLDLDEQIPSLLATFANDGKPFHLLAVHFLPPYGKLFTARRNAAFAELPEVLEKLAHPALVIGDFNATPWCYPFRRLLAETELLDSTVGFGLQTTFPTYLKVMSIPIDHCLYTPGIQIIHREVGAEVGSDHWPLLVDFHL